ncbi:MAG: hypothetical protein EZS28_032568, partial [Streblomastix strix]
AVLLHILINVFQKQDEYLDHQEVDFQACLQFEYWKVLELVKYWMEFEKFKHYMLIKHHLQVIVQLELKERQSLVQVVKHIFQYVVIVIQTPEEEIVIVEQLHYLVATMLDLPVLVEKFAAIDHIISNFDIVEYGGYTGNICQAG